MNTASRAGRRVAGVAVLLVAAVLAASCASRSNSSAPPPAPPATPSHQGHGPIDVPAAAPLRAGERFVSLEMPRSYTPKAPNGGTDEYRCFLIDPRVADTAYLTGSQFLPQNGDIVHHAILFRVGAGDVAKARKLDARTPGDGWTCFGDDGVAENTAWVGHWAPGANETLLDAGLGYPMPAGSQLVLQVHYNLLATEGRPGPSDRSGVRLRLVENRKLQALETALLPAPVELPCATGESGKLCDRDAAVRDVKRRFGAEEGDSAAQLNKYCNGGRPPVAGATQHCDHKVPGKATVRAVAGHMHLLGRSIKVELNPGTATAKTLLDIPTYDFDDQAIRPLAGGQVVTPSDTLRVTCTHDAGLRRQLPALQNQPPRYVVWGDGTSDEMCLGLLIFSAN